MHIGHIENKSKATHCTDCLFGTEFVGRRSDTGERVMGFVNNRSFATHVYANKELITKIPDNWSMVEASSLGQTYFTVWYSLIRRAQLKQSIFAILDFFL